VDAASLRPFACLPWLGIEWVSFISTQLDAL
jgi:hypothetical protein